MTQEKSVAGDYAGRIEDSLLESVVGGTGPATMGGSGLDGGDGGSGELGGSDAPLSGPGGGGPTLSLEQARRIKKQNAAAPCGRGTGGNNVAGT